MTDNRRKQSGLWKSWHMQWILHRHLFFSFYFRIIVISSLLFPLLTKPFEGLDPVTGHVTSVTSGPPVTARLRRLALGKLAVAKSNFDTLLTYGTVRLRHSLWILPLQMVLKKDRVSWRPRGDYRALNTVTWFHSYAILYTNDITAQPWSLKSIWYEQITRPQSSLKTMRKLHSRFLSVCLSMPFGFCNAAKMF